MAILGIVGGSQSFSSTSGGKVYAYDAINNLANTVVAPANTARQKITFHNPGVNDILIFPTTKLNAAGLAVPNTPNVGALGGTFRLFANGGTWLFEGGEYTGSWQAYSIDGVANPLTVVDSNIG